MRAQETRRILDRLYGYEVSPLLWRKVRPRLSAGRVQSVAVRLIVRTRTGTDGVCFWHVVGLAGQFRQTRRSNARSPADVGRRTQDSIWQGFRLGHGQAQKRRNDVARWRGGQRTLAERIKSGEFRVASVEDKPYTTKPYPPFTTSTLQQEANRKLGFTARRAMQVAQSLYENGHITYMRTDSTNLANVAIEDARNLVERSYGDELFTRRTAGLQIQSQECPRSSRSDPPGGPSVRIARNDAWRAE